MQSLEDALLAIMNGTYNDEYAIELAKRDYEGENRIKKAMHVMNKMTRNESSSAIHHGQRKENFCSVEEP